MRQLIDRVEDAQRLWAMAIPSIQAPTADRFVSWLGTFSDSEFEHAIVRASNRLHHGGIVEDTSEVCRYISGVLTNEANKTKAKLGRIAARQAKQDGSTAQSSEAGHNVSA